MIRKLLLCAMLAVVFVPRLTRAQETDTVSQVTSYLYYDAAGEDTNSTVASQVVSFLYNDALDEDTNSHVASHVVSYLYYDGIGSDTNLAVVSPVISFLYGDAPGEDANSPVASRVMSFLYYDAPGEDTNAAVLSRAVSYLYYDWPGDSAFNLQHSPTVSYYYQFLDAPVLTIIPTNRTPKEVETTCPIFAPSQLLAYNGGLFTTNLASIDPNQMTIVLTHGWNPTILGTPVFPNGGAEGWPTDMAAQFHAKGITANIVAWNWKDAATSSLLDPKQAGGHTPQQGIALGQALTNALGQNYSQKIHFIGHSFGTLVNAYAANFLQGSNWAAEAVSSTPWPGTNMQMTLFDEAEVGADKDFNLNSKDLTDLADALVSGNGNYLNLPSSFYHPLPKQFAWADNYVSAIGLLHPNAVNVILTNGFPADAPDPVSWFYEFGAFHNYPVHWYDETIQTDVSAMGFLWSFERGGLFSQAPATNSVYVQAGSEWNLSATNWSYGTNFIHRRILEYGNGLGNSTAASFVDNGLEAFGTVIGQLLQVPNTPDFNTIINLASTPAPSATPEFRAHPSGEPAGSESSTNVPAYAWMQLIVPPNAVSLSFNYKIQGDWQNDSLAAAFNGTNVLLIAGNVIQTNVTFSSGSIDVSAFAGQTNEFFIGIVGGTSTNAQLTVENLAFSIAVLPSLQAQASVSNLMLSWPLSAQNFSLQTTTNLSDPNSWVTLTNVPAIVNLQNAITNSVSDGARFYRLKK